MQQKFETEQAERAGYTPDEYREIVRRAQRIRAEEEGRLSPEALAESAAEVGIREEDLRAAERQIQQEREELAQRQAQKRASTRMAAWVAAAVLAFFLLFSVVSYNGLNSHRLAATEARANLQSTLQRRAELLPQLAQWAREGASVGRQLPDQISQAREGLTSGDVNAQLQASRELDALLPTLRSGGTGGSALYQDMMAEMAGSANRINVARQRYNRAVTQYNQSAQSFPNNLVRPLFGLPKELPPLEGASGG